MNNHKTPLVTPFVIAERDRSSSSASVYLSTLESRIRIATGDSIPTALKNAASLLGVLALGAQCEANLVDTCYPDREIVLAGGDYGRES